MIDKPPLFWIILVVFAAMVIGGVVFYIGTTSSGNSVRQGIGNVSDTTVVGFTEEIRNIPTLAVNATLPSVPEEIMVYTAIRGIDREGFRHISNELGIHGEEKEEFGFIISKTELSQLDTELSTGVISYKNQSKQPDYDEASIDKYLPSDEEARKIADDFLATKNLRPDDAVFLDITHNEGFLLGDPPRKCSESINVEYIHEINGHKFLTDQLRIEIGAHGAVLSMFKKWTDYKPFREYPLITPDDAIKSIKKSGVVIPTGMKDPQKATVTEVSIGYIGETQSGILPYLIPVYVFEGTVEGADGGSAAFYQWIPATPEFAAEIT